jgi:regulator of nucleoside diphosphate kinase
VSLPKKVITEPDRWRLKQAIEAARSAWRSFRPHLDWLAGQLRDAHVVPAEEVAHDVITMNSRVEVEDVRTKKLRTITIVYPDQAVAELGEVSVFDPAGLALLGMRVGDFLFWTEPGAQRTGRVTKLHYQPEAAGHYDL